MYLHLSLKKEQAKNGLDIITHYPPLNKHIFIDSKIKIDNKKQKIKIKEQ